MISYTILRPLILNNKYLSLGNTRGRWHVIYHCKLTARVIRATHVTLLSEKLQSKKISFTLVFWRDNKKKDYETPL